LFFCELASKRPVGAVKQGCNLSFCQIFFFGKK
jgi:hypothetical protein